MKEDGIYTLSHKHMHIALSSEEEKKTHAHKCKQRQIKYMEHPHTVCGPNCEWLALGQCLMGFGGIGLTAVRWTSCFG